MNSFFDTSPEVAQKLGYPREGATYYARLDQSEYEAPTEGEPPRTILRLEAFLKPWFDDYLGSGFLKPGGSEETFIEFYSRAPLATLELEVLPDHPGRFPLLGGLLKAAEADVEPEQWFRIEAGEFRRGGLSDEAVRMTVFPQLLGEGALLTLGAIETVDDETARRLDEAVTPSHIEDANVGDVRSILNPSGRGIEWVMVYDVGQGNAIGLCDAAGTVLTYFDFGGGTGNNTRTFPSALKHFCFSNNPSIILSHWDSDHWSSANRDQQALPRHWIAPLQKLGPVQAAMIAGIQGAGGRVHLLASGFPPIQMGQIQLEQATGTGRNHSGIVLTLSENLDGSGSQILMPGDADYRHIASFVPSSQASPYLSVVAAHHGGKLKAGTTVPGNQRQDF